MYVLNNNCFYDDNNIIFLHFIISLSFNLNIHYFINVITCKLQVVIQLFSKQSL